MWAAGLFVGEGCFYLHKRKYLSMKISMHDRRAIERFFRATLPYVGQALGTRPTNPRVIAEPYTYHGQPRVNYTVRYGGNAAHGIMRALFPYLENTDKGDQLLRLASQVGVQI